MTFSTTDGVKTLGELIRATTSCEPTSCLQCRCLRILVCRVIADLMRGVFYQKCHDPECRRANFRSIGKSMCLSTLLCLPIRGVLNGVVL